MEVLSNNPPANAALLDAIEAARQEAMRIPAEITPDIAPRVVDALKKYGLLLADAEAVRKDEKAPVLAEGRDIDAAWNDRVRPLAETVKRLRAGLCGLPACLQIRGEFGALATFRPEPAHEIEDLAAVPLDALRPFLDITAIEKAVARAVKAGVQLEGVRTFSRTGVTTR